MFTDSILSLVGFPGVFLTYTHQSELAPRPDGHLTIQAPGLIRGQLQGEDNKVTYLAIPLVQPAVLEGDNSPELGKFSLWLSLLFYTSRG